MDDEIVREFSYSLKQNLLTDNYGGWKKLDPDLLDSLCDRMAREAADYISNMEQPDNLDSVPVLLSAFELIRP